MARVKRGVTSRAKHNKVFKAGQGLLRPPQEHDPGRKGCRRSFEAVCLPRPQGQQAQLPRSVDPAYQRCRPRAFGLTYGRFIDGLNKAGIEVDRKVLSDMAIHEPEAFGALVDASKKALAYLKDAGTANEFESAVK